MQMIPDIIDKIPEVVEIALNDMIKDCKNDKDILKLVMSHGEQIEPDHMTEHTFKEGLYIRQMSAPAGSLIVGHFHKKDNLNMFLQGTLAMLSDSGKWVLMRAPEYFFATPGRKIAYILEDTVWCNIYSTDKTTVTEVEEEILDKSIMEDEEIKSIRVNINSCKNQEPET